jgi:hypothetical protein
MFRCIVVIMILGSTMSCSNILGLSEPKHQDADTVSDVCRFDEAASTFDGICLFGN